MKLGKQKGCLFDDRIDVEFSPCNLEALIEMAKDKAMSERSYTSVGVWRKIKDLLQKRHDEWRRLRDEKDDPGKTYKVKDSRKGNFTMKVTAINGDFADGTIIEGTARYLT